MNDKVNTEDFSTLPKCSECGESFTAVLHRPKRLPRPGEWEILITIQKSCECVPCTQLFVDDGFGPYLPIDLSSHLD